MFFVESSYIFFFLFSFYYSYYRRNYYILMFTLFTSFNLLHRPRDVYNVPLLLDVLITPARVHTKHLTWKTVNIPLIPPPRIPEDCRQFRNAGYTETGLAKYSSLKTNIRASNVLTHFPPTAFMAPNNNFNSLTVIL